MRRKNLWTFLNLRCVNKLPFQNSIDLQYVIPDLKFQFKERKTKPEKDKIEDKTKRNDDHKLCTQDNQVKLMNYDQNMVIAYLARKFPESYNINLRMIHEIKLKYPKFKPYSVLDYGAGLSPTGHALHHIFPELELIFALEPNMYMQKLGKYMSKDIESFTWAQSIHETKYLGDSKKFDIVNCSFVLEELVSSEERLLVVESLFERTAENGFLTFVLPGSPMGFRFLNDIRERVIKKSRNEFNIIAPCPHHLECPLAKNDRTWCRFEQNWLRYPKNVLAKLPHEHTLIQSRFCYLIIKKGPVIRSLNQVKSFEDQTFFWDRIIKPTKKKGGHNIVTLCNSKGKVEQRIVARSHELQFGYKESKFLKWGDLWKFPLRIPNKYRKEIKEGKKLF